MNDYWEHQEAINCDNYQCIFNDIKTRIRYQYIQEFFTNINNNARPENIVFLKLNLFMKNIFILWIKKLEMK